MVKPTDNSPLGEDEPSSSSFKKTAASKSRYRSDGDEEDAADQSTATEHYHDAPSQAVGIEYYEDHIHIPSDERQDDPSSSQTPHLLQDFINDGNVDKLQQALERNFNELASNQFYWLHQLAENGMKASEIAQLLIDVERDDPWLYYAPSSSWQVPLLTDFHHKSCIHNAMDAMVATDSEDLPRSGRRSWILRSNLAYVEQQSDIKRIIVERIGFAGIIPVSRNWLEWDGRVEISRDGGLTTAFVSYGSPAHEVFDFEDLLQIMRRIGDRLRLGFGLLQNFPLCCDSFTVLVAPFGGSLLSPLIRLSRIGFGECVRLLNCVREVSLGGLEAILEDLRAASLDLLLSFLRGVDPNIFKIDGEISALLHQVALALQMMSIGLLSYINAHSGPIRPRFLGTPVHRVVFLGIGSASNGTRVAAGLANLTCMKGLTRSQVFAFGEVNEHAVDLLATPTDVVDTWGPARLIRNANHPPNQEVLGIEIGEGLLARSPERGYMLHWKEFAQSEELMRSVTTGKGFDLDSHILMGAISVNDACPLRLPDNEKSATSTFTGDLYKVGTVAPGWYQKSFQIGLAAGKYTTVSVGASFEKRDGVTMKKRILRDLRGSTPQVCLEDLEAFHGLQLSLCTGVARRVPLRVLLAEALPTYVLSCRPAPAGWDAFGSTLIQALRDSTLLAWFHFHKEHEIAAVAILSKLLLHLEDTGIDSQGHLSVAWITPQHTQLGIKLNCDKENLWAKILEDTDQCATFACITVSCLESDDTGCQSKNGFCWRGVSELLTTEVYRYSNDTSRGSRRQQQQPFELREDKKYWIGPINSGLVASAKIADPPTLEITRDFFPGVPERYKYRLMLAPSLQRMRLRERGGFPEGGGVQVTVRTRTS
ncbi:hypothetical protein Q7P37_001450 [Cladosporium fusiforme]